MTIPKEIIELAVRGGWKIPRTFYSESRQKDAIVDPTFWCALGKSCGWDNEHWYLYLNKHTSNPIPFGVETSVAYGLLFTHLILTQQPTDTFWEEILATKK